MHMHAPSISGFGSRGVGPKIPSAKKLDIFRRQKESVPIVHST